MTMIDRRGFVAALGAATTLPATIAVGAHDAGAKQRRAATRNPETASCFIRYGYSACHERSAVDFWSQPLFDIDHDKYLPREMARGQIWHDYDDFAGELDFRVDGDLATALTSTVRGGHSQRTAFIALDSVGALGNQEWPELLPSFRRCYHRIIGYFHLERRGLIEWKQWLEETVPPKSGKSFFQSFFCDCIAQCDAVVLTSPALVECDLGLTPGASARIMVGEQIRRLGHALLDPLALDQIAGTHGSTHRPRLFALGSNSFYAPKGFQPAHFVGNFDWSFKRQADLVHNAFGMAGPNDLPLLVTTCDDRHPKDSAKLSYRCGRYVRECKLSACPEDRRHSEDIEAVEMITLWPFEMDGELQPPYPA